ncbi:GNAT family N-acetyltransferase [Tissierella sp.]|uniref:GNAT family N-acetyltransferase n=1 Tax=Tissierella sp. TaxID=41274 RepID=UPI002857BF0D|nr:GNAT family N-acetyltransferase [Tissierella sp.]MDR7855152.1 GNAT family N-acetyltransferase [Tissierella sp.]
MIIRLANIKDEDKIAMLIARFRIELKGLRGIDSDINIEESKMEFREYMDKGYLIFVAENGNKDLIGYLVCMIEDDVVWAESLFVASECRRAGIASRLYDKAEELAKKLGEDQVYNWIHPNNHGIISFLSKRGYNVLNLIEVRKPSINEKLIEKIRVGEHEYSY